MEAWLIDRRGTGALTPAWALSAHGNGRGERAERGVSVRILDIIIELYALLQEIIN